MGKETGKPGPDPMPPRDGDKIQARQRINVEVRTGYRPHPNTLPCTDCGHVYAPGERRHEYDHHLGYAAEHHYDVEPVCSTCHSNRDCVKQKAACKRGHPLEGINVLMEGAVRRCRACRTEYERARHPASFWREYRRKKAANG